MAATELHDRPEAVAEIEVHELNEKAAEQVSRILEETHQGKTHAKPTLAYRIPSPGVRYYF